MDHKGHRVITPRGAKPCCLLKNWHLLLIFIAPGIALLYIKVGFRRRGGNISVDLSLFVSLYNTNFMNKLKFNDFFKTKIIH